MIKLPKLDIKTILIVILSLVLIYSLKTCNDKNNDNTALSLENQQLDSMYNAKSQLLIASQTEVTLSQEAFRRATDSMFAMNKRFENRIREILAFYKATTNTVIREVEIPYIDSIGRIAWEDSIKKQCKSVIDYYEANAIIVPRTAKDSTKNYTADLTATLTGIKINNLLIPDSQYIRFIELKGGLFKKDASGKRKLVARRSFQVQVIHSNPLIQTTSTTSAIYRPPKKGRWLEKALLIGAGIFLGTKL
jgi:hypothetical protein